MNVQRVFTGGFDSSRHLCADLQRSISCASRIDIIVSFLMYSGVKKIVDDLKGAAVRNVPIRILTGRYLGITHPAALYLIKKELGPSAELKFFAGSEDISFHPKAYFFHYNEAPSNEVYIGSSNLSLSALTGGIEWNYRLCASEDAESFASFYQTFTDLYENHSLAVTDDVLREYSKSWKATAVYRHVRHLEEPKAEQFVSRLEVTPKEAQVEALYALQEMRDDGETKALVQAATGFGKTYLAAFDSRDFERVLFVAHRDEILQQASSSFFYVRGTHDAGFFTGTQKDIGKKVIFASVQTLGRDMYLNDAYFTRDYFDYIIIDEFHHAAAPQYKKIVDYFTPRFLLGITATPERMDGQNVYALCDYNVAYELTLKDAINKDVLVPFHYYGIYDDTDYSEFRLVKGCYDERDLNRAYINNDDRSFLILNHYKKHYSQRALGFCSSRSHAEYMAGFFMRSGISAAAVYSGEGGEYSEARSLALEKLTAGTLRVIFSVDMFNEGVDIPSLDMVMFLRPTESPVVFIQQLGRGLRKCSGKEYVTVLDFIGNYTNAALAPSSITGRSHASPATMSPRECRELLPDGCTADFDLKLIDLYKKLAQKEMPVKQKIAAEFLRIQELLGQRPTRTQLFTEMSTEVYQLCRSHPSENPLKNYLKFLDVQNLLSADEKLLFRSIAGDFINLIETTTMTKSYKMPILRAFYNSGRIRMHIDDHDILSAWKKFYAQNANFKDLERVHTRADFEKITDAAHLSNAKKNPVNFLAKSGKGFFIQDPRHTLSLSPDLAPWIENSAFIEHLRDAIEYKTLYYYETRSLQKNHPNTPYIIEERSPLIAADGD